MKQGEMYYTGTVVEIIDPVLYEILVDIPGIIQGVKAYPTRGELDEPKVGDFVLLRSLDPTFQSYYLWTKLKENDFIGFRSNGKMVDITPDYVKVCIFDPTTEYNDLGEEYRPEPTDWIKLDKDGNLEISLRANSNITIAGTKTEKVEGDQTEEYTSNLNIKVGGNVSMEVSGNTELNCPNVTVTGGTFNMKGQSSTDMSGPFNCIPTCPFSGAPHSGSKVSGT